ncbi:hypothetical protein CTEN210_01358 [Chaetoceros tenuissimus]|uniref:Uncharacterized protein n=2 Tax=Chaetoceros tenuissimus TaxID=426638 RepID=A0AAD3GZT6_9STRA|nr:hypothetical protein CTEN210_01358 [Chaetoceros tenuissimus]
MASMPLTNRKKPTSLSLNENAKDIESNSSNSNDSQGKGKKSYAGILLYYSFLVSLILSAIAYYVSSIEEGGKHKMTKASQNNYQIKTQKYNIHIDFQHDDEAKQNIGLGPHSIHVMTEESCPDPQVYVTVEGDAMVNVELQKEENKDNLWTGKFHVPMGGSYYVQTRYVDCKGTAVNDAYGSKYEFQVISDATGPIEKEVGGVAFVNGAWIAKEKVLKNTSYFDTGYPYIFANPEMVNKKEEMTALAGNGEVMKESVVTKSHGYYRFGELSNYELVCWIGSDSANALRDAFKSIRGGIFAGQRPFKFHLYPMKDLVKPDKEWTEATSGAFRKCKHILISFDEPETPLSQSLYKEQITTFIKHLVNAQNAETTFPALIWMFTVMESPLNTKNCYDPVLPRTTNHPCNDVLRDLFQDSPFPSRVRLLDNTDVSASIVDENRASMLAIVALRIFVMVGHQVQLWREDGGQIGGINGLTKNGVTTPNYNLEPYDWSQSVERSIF